MSKKFEYNCLMVEFDIPQWEHLSKGYISESDLFEGEGFGIENEPHVTVLFGLHPEVTAEHIKPFLLPLTDILVEFDKIDAFHLDEYDVLKFNAKSNELKFIHEQLCSKFPHHKEYPYNSHMTIGYLTKECAKKYTKELKNPFALIPSKYKFSYTDGNSETFEL